jgi:hypothetical protein
LENQQPLVFLPDNNTKILVLQLICFNFVWYYGTNQHWQVCFGVFVLLQWCGRLDFDHSDMQSVENGAVPVIIMHHGKQA